MTRADRAAGRGSPPLVRQPSDAFNTLGAAGGFIYTAATGIVAFVRLQSKRSNLITWLTKGIDLIKKFASESEACKEASRSR